MDVARAQRLQPVFQRLGVTEIGILVDEFEALEASQGTAQHYTSKVPSAAMVSKRIDADLVTADEMAELRAAQAKRRERDERAAQQRRRA